MDGFDPLTIAKRIANSKEPEVANGGEDISDSPSQNFFPHWSGNTLLDLFTIAK